MVYFNECVIIKCTLVFIFYYEFDKESKRPTMTTGKFYKQAPIHFYRLLRVQKYRHCFSNYDSRQKGHWELKLGLEL